MRLVRRLVPVSLVALLLCRPVGAEGPDARPESAGTTPTAATIPSTLPGKLGMGHVVGFTPAANQPTIAALAQTAGVAWSREEFPWHLIELNPSGQPGVYTFTNYDTIVNNTVAAGISMIGLIAYTPQFYSSNPGAANYYIWHTTSGAGRAAWSTYVSAVVNRYKDRIHIWQLWPIAEDAEFRQPQPGVSEYYELLWRGFDAVKAADPTATVLPVAADPPFFDSLLDLGAGSKMDALAVHSYCQPYAPETSTLMQLRIAALRNLSARRLAGKPLFETEYGWPTSTDFWGVPEDTEAAYGIRSMLLQGAEPDIASVLWIDLQDSAYGGVWTNDNFYDNFGMLLKVGTTFGKKSAYDAYAAMTTALSGATFGREIRPKPTVQTIENFEGSQSWSVYLGGGATGTYTKVNTTQKSGAFSGKIDYTLNSSPGAGVVLAPNPLVTIPVTGTPTRVRITAKGDGTPSPLLVVTIKDSQGETFGLSLGLVEDTNWRDYTYDLDAPAGTSSVMTYDSVGANPGVINFPVVFQDYSIHAWSNASSVTSGTVYVDDVRFETGPSVIDQLHHSPTALTHAIWTTNGGGTTFPISTNAASLTTRDWHNTTATVTPSNGVASIPVDTHPIFATMNFCPAPAGTSPVAPTLSSPASNASGVSPNPVTLSWGAVAGASRYSVYIGTASPPPFYAETTGTSLQTTITPSMLYHWKVAAIPAVGSGGVASSAVQDFTTSTGAGRGITTISPTFVNRWQSTPVSVTVSGSGFGSTTGVSWSGPSPTPGAFSKTGFTATTISGNLTPHSNIHAGRYDVRVGNSGASDAAKLQGLAVRAFTDVTEADWYFESSERMVTAGIMPATGIPTSPTFSPTQIITRGDMAQFLVNAYFWMTSPAGVPTRSCLSYFPDVACGNAQRNWIEWAKDLGITNGSADGNFYPASNVTRAEMAAFLDRLVYFGDGTTPKCDADPGWSDLASIPGWARPYVNRLRMDRITAGCSASPLTYCPLGSVQRADIATFLARIVGEIPLP